MAGCAARNATTHVELWPDRVTTGDFDGDGSLDVVTWGFFLFDTFIPTAFVLSGDGHGGLAAAVEIELPGAPMHVLARDLDRDGVDDLIVDRDGWTDLGYFARDRGLWLMRGRGATFADPEPLVTGDYITPIAFADLDDDDRIELVAMRHGDEVITMGSDGTTRPWTPRVPSDTSLSVRDGQVADFLGDASPELALVARERNLTRLLIFTMHDS